MRSSGEKAIRYSLLSLGFNLPISLFLNIIEVPSVIISPLSIWNNSFCPFPEIPAIPKHSPFFKERFKLFKFVSYGSSLLKFKFEIFKISSLFLKLLIFFLIVFKFSPTILLAKLSIFSSIVLVTETTLPFLITATSSQSDKTSFNL